VSAVTVMQNNNKLGPEEFGEIRRLVYESIGVNLTEPKKALVVSRLSRRLKELRLDTFAQYLRYLKSDPQEIGTFFNCLTTNVTSFFREAHHFEYLQNTFLPALESNFSPKTGGRKIRAWSAGCSTGEEPYTLAMVLEDYFRGKKGWGVDILASDINTETLEKASRGIYRRQEVKGISYDYLRKHFKLGAGPNQGLFKVKENLQKMITFCQLNLASLENYPVGDPFDFIFCRNVFIYFDKPTRARVLRRFHQHLLPGGLLFLGHSESIDLTDEESGQWRSVKHTVYEKLP